MWRDEEGYIFFHGRDDDIILSAGYRIGPTEVEEELMKHPSVMDVGVIGKKDKTRGEVVKAFIVLAPGFQPSEELKIELHRFVSRNLAAHESPKVIEFVESLPKTPSGKLQRKVLRMREDETLQK
eukprot:TRINITY_DN8330_c0_g1_i14.p1 TRINITY_DN8330_c0_g1~~TRINITY_DN8330_c0_g1_i14.p1  ORF type:complete len:125 (-),score=41.10 TRINITY_DN8330_c0_g1_i14:53-427(-)